MVPFCFVVVLLRIFCFSLIFGSFGFVYLCFGGVILIVVLMVVFGLTGVWGCLGFLGLPFDFSFLGL